MVTDVIYNLEGLCSELNWLCEVDCRVIRNSVNYWSEEDIHLELTDARHRDQFLSTHACCEICVVSAVRHPLLRVVHSQFDRSESRKQRDLDFINVTSRQALLRRDLETQ